MAQSFHTDASPLYQEALAATFDYMDCPDDGEMLILLESQVQQAKIRLFAAEGEAAIDRLHHEATFQRELLHMIEEELERQRKTGGTTKT